ncbi:uncharacterized protein AMSG_06250 [Thecamonas trahens ATCC 50062]|uniref:Guanylate cyclase domain-containing protein n=1 Tax=Thecamonas trahens ATCC 50062 TaxID=461836 RepID=A0A0L0DC78_THETB|nr:hypothetical protein AMSG_06250 [Thecamonas trahens ATCC 50062]KNC49942.1 hypothetical protein AMSG_06250 [Thecamonas trahens ATCC 50062]|eukprot:XP_013757419.1 hypothetical protein AMSG_06250 [Thecamonas trahens ATCC 50062]
MTIVMILLLGHFPCHTHALASCSSQIFNSTSGVTAGYVNITGGYPAAVDCIYQFDYLQGGLQLIFDSFDTKPPFDHLIVYRGLVGDWSEVLADMSGNSPVGARIGEPIFFNASQISIRFRALPPDNERDGVAFSWERRLGLDATDFAVPPEPAIPTCAYNESSPGVWPSLDIDADISIEMRVTVNSFSTQTIFAFLGDNTRFIVGMFDDSNPQYGPDPDADYAVTFSAGYSPGYIRYESDAPVGTFTQGVERHIAGVFDATTSTWTIYVDGAPTSSSWYRSAFFTYYTYGAKTATRGLYLGRFDGSVRDVRVWNRTLSDGEVSSRASATLSGCEQGLVALLRPNGIGDFANLAGIGCGGASDITCSIPPNGVATNWTTLPLPVACGDGFRESSEQCDDGNTNVGDGCDASCNIVAPWSCSGDAPTICLEPGYACLTPGAPCTTCAHPNGMDCAGTCDGNAILDACNVCSGGTTNRLPNADRDDCGVCFGGNADRDDCGVCFGANTHKDGCGVCFGSNATCAGCDGVPNSGLVRDVCGVCDGDGSSCLGCDGVPIPSGGAHFDACGVCGGNATVCYVGCDGVYGSSIHYDCHSVCGGNATIDSCGMCAGGNVSTPLPYNYHLDSCGVCFGQDLTCTTCASGVLDACGVCDGDNSTCVGCDGIRVSDGGALFDLCGVCGGDGSSCIMGCDGVLGSSAIYDCTGTCSGTAAIDECNSCAGGTSLIPTANFFRDSCGVCFRGNADRDSCGVCFGDDADLDSCGVCRGHNAAMDDCGVCFGSNLAKDDCGTCYGNNTVCAGCDGIPNSGKTLKSCGMCSAADVECPPNTKTTEGGLSIVTVAAMSGALLVLCLVLIAAIVLLYRSRRSASVSAYHAALADKAPQGEIFIVTTDIQDSTALWEANPEQMILVLDKHNEIMRAAIAATGGYEFKTEGDAFFVAYEDVEAMISFTCGVQRALMDVSWPNWLLSLMAEGRPACWNGIRVRMGVHYGRVSSAFDVRAGRSQYFGGMANLATLVTDAAWGGQIALSRQVVDRIASARSSSPSPSTSRSAVALAPLAVLVFSGLAQPCEIWEMLPADLASRSLCFTDDRMRRIARSAILLTGDVFASVWPDEDAIPSDIVAAPALANRMTTKQALSSLGKSTTNTFPMASSLATSSPPNTAADPPSGVALVEALVRHSIEGTSPSERLANSRGRSPSGTRLSRPRSISLHSTEYHVAGVISPRGHACLQDRNGSQTARAHTSSYEIERCAVRRTKTHRNMARTSPREPRALRTRSARNMVSSASHGQVGTHLAVARARNSRIIDGDGNSSEASGASDASNASKVSHAVTRKRRVRVRSSSRARALSLSPALKPLPRDDTTPTPPGSVTLSRINRIAHRRRRSTNSVPTTAETKMTT